MAQVNDGTMLNAKAKAMLESTKESKRGLLKLFLGAGPGVKLMRC